jgi:glycosyltransferase involved in cell wall biosynthesis
MTRPRYVLVTAAYNEERHIADTLRCVASQSVLPHRWVIVSDGSTDRTDEIVVEWAKRHPFIDFVRVDRSAKHSFSAKVHALRQGFARVADLEDDFIGVLDADVSLEPDYFQRLLEHFANEPRLGIGPLKARFKWGRVTCDLGYHPLFQLARAVYRVRERPYLLGSMAELAGFAVSKVRNPQPSIDPDVVRFLRREQLTKLRRLAAPRRPR